MAGNRPIDRMRDSGGTMTIGDADDDSAITEMISTSEKLYCVKRRGIYAVQIADQIDPIRANPAISDTQQKIFSVGSDSPIVARTLLTAHRLFKKTFLGQNFDEDHAIALALNLLEDFLALDATRGHLEDVIESAKNGYGRTVAAKNATHLPSTKGLKQSLDSFAQKMGHIVNTLEDVAKLFYGAELSRKWIDSLARLVAEKYGEDSEFAIYMQGASEFLLLANSIRNLIEHPKADEYIALDDFKLLPTGMIDLPAITLVRLGQENAKATVTLWMQRMVDDLVSVCEVLIAHLCGANVQPLAGFPTFVTELPVEQRGNPIVRFSYASMMGDRIIPAG